MAQEFHSILDDIKLLTSFYDINEAKVTRLELPINQRKLEIVAPSACESLKEKILKAKVDNVWPYRLACTRLRREWDFTRQDFCLLRSSLILAKYHEIKSRKCSLLEEEMQCNTILVLPASFVNLGEHFPGDFERFLVQRPKAKAGHRRYGHAKVARQTRTKGAKFNQQEKISLSELATTDDRRWSAVLRLDYSRYESRLREVGE